MAKFTVDTHLFRELGELLVGRDSTALVELMKNSYDADAKSSVVYGEALDDPERGVIRITDDGVGMTFDEFNQGFLRIASRTREEGNRLSKRFGRRFTGAKGIGRLAAHKLARILEIHSVPWVSQSSHQKEVIEARIDWDAVERKQTIEELDDTAVSASSQPAPNSLQHGTVITLRRLRGRWTQTQLGRFLAQVQTFEPPPVLTTALRESCVHQPLLFKEPIVRHAATDDPGFHAQLEGEFAGGDEYWQTLLEVASWVIEIDAPLRHPTVRCAVAPTSRTLHEYPSSRREIFKIDHPDPAGGPFFQARILVREGAARGSTAEKAWSQRSAGIRVFMEGFRILPYGELKDDWLSLDSDYARRSRSIPGLEEEEAPTLQGDRDEGLVVLPNRQYFGAVFLTLQGAPTLKMLVNREGFVPDTSFDNLVMLVRRSIHLATRVRASVKSESRRTRKEKRASNRSEGDHGASQSMFASVSETLRVSMNRAVSLAKEATRLGAEGSIPRATQALLEGIAECERAAEASQELLSEVPMVRVLASVGTQMASFIHEVRGLVGMAESLDSVIERLRKNPALPRILRSDIAKLHGSIGDLKRNLARQASYLLDVVTPDARRRRSRQSLAARFDAGRRLVEHSAERNSIRIENDISPDLKSPPMFQAELTTIFGNLLTNAVKAAGGGGRIRANASRLSDGRTRLVIQNTGAAIDPETGERWFRPYESTTTNVDPVLGQGMGLGLPITRDMLEEYGAEIRFAVPNRGYATSIEILFPE